MVLMIPPDLLLASTEASFDADYTRVWCRAQGAYYTEGRFSFLVHSPTVSKMDLQMSARYAALAGADQVVWFFTAWDGDHQDDPNVKLYAALLYLDMWDTRQMVRRRVSIEDDGRVVGVGEYESVEARGWLADPLMTPWLWGPESLSVSTLLDVCRARGIRVVGKVT